jgi:hypothetical protein
MPPTRREPDSPGYRFRFESVTLDALNLSLRYIMLTWSVIERNVAVISKFSADRTAEWNKSPKSGRRLEKLA